MLSDLHDRPKLTDEDAGAVEVRDDRLLAAATFQPCLSSSTRTAT
jgi:hypothetical protein